MQFHNERSTPMPGTSERGKLTLPWSLLLLGSGYFLLVAGPLLTSRFAGLRWARDLASGRAWVPAPAAAGAALLGAAALIYVVARLVRDVEQRPYASIAPVLAVFSGFVLTSTRTVMPLPGAGAPQLGILVLALALLGGVLIGRASVAERALGWVLAVLPSLALVAALNATLGHADPISMLRAVDPGLRTYLMLLAVSSLSLGLVGVVARYLVPRPAASEGQSLAHTSGRFDGQGSLSQSGSFNEPALRLPRPQTMPAPVAFRPQAPVTARAPEGALRLSARAPEGALRLSARAPEGALRQQQRTATLLGTPALRQTMPPLPRSSADPRASGALGQRPVGPTGYGYGYAQPTGLRLHQPTPITSELALDDPDLLLLTRGKFSVGRVLPALLLLALAALVGTYFFVVRPRQHDADLARVRSAALHPTAVDSQVSKPRAGVGDGSSDQALPPAADALGVARENVPVVTPFEPTAIEPGAQPGAQPTTEPAAIASAAAPVDATQQALPSADADQPAEHVHRSRSHARHRHASEAKPTRANDAEREARPASDSELSAAAAVRALKNETVEKKAPAKLQAPAPAPETRNESDLDLDQLVHKALKSSNGVNAQEDPILGL